ncbi:hypothetical protein LSAT2_004040 [Lamellibrachia satsuma]|nr:hypothetical protein LSAT2_004040 [Lamellibrachia satsuma]
MTYNTMTSQLLVGLDIAWVHYALSPHQLFGVLVCRWKTCTITSYELTHSHRPQRRTRRSAQDVANSTRDVANSTQDVANSTRDVANSTGDSDEISSHERIFYKLSAYGIDFHLNLTRNNRLVSPSFVVQYWNKGGVASQHSDVEHCHYEGHIVNRERRSSVAISNCRGLVSDALYSLFHFINTLV